jgi:Multicopper oxidase
MAWQGADWDGKASADATSGWKPCPSELRYASKDVSIHRHVVLCQRAQLVARMYLQPAWPAVRIQIHCIVLPIRTCHISEEMTSVWLASCAQVMHIGANVGRITLAARWGPNLGEYMMHCHNNVHEDNDMFRAFMVRTGLC